MAKSTKYAGRYARVHEMAADDPTLPSRPVELERLGPQTTLERLGDWGTRIGVPLILPIFRRWKPVVRFYGLHWITRDADVRAAMSDHEAFHVPFGPEMAHITGSSTFALGDDGALHERQRAAMDAAWTSIDDERDVRRPARHFANAMIDDSGGKVDVVGELIRQVVARSAEHLLGCDVRDYTAFSDAVIAISTLLFADPYGRRRVRTEGLLGARTLKPIVDDAVARAITTTADQDEYTHAEGEFEAIMPGMARYLRTRIGLPLGERPDETYDERNMREDLEAIAYGLMTGFAVTHGFVAGVLTTLSKRPEAWRHAVRLACEIDEARKEDPQALQRERIATFDALMVEAARFTPAIFPGSFRIRTHAPVRDGNDALDGIEPGASVIVCTASAVMDGRCGRFECERPCEFEPNRFSDRRLDSSLAFGRGHHHCIGAYQAIGIASETLIALLSKPGIRFAQRRPKVQMIGAVHASLPMRFDTETGGLKQSQIAAAVPLDEPNRDDELMSALRAIASEGHLARAFRTSRVIHFASLNVVRLGRRGRERPHLLVEINVDGTPRQALRKIARAVENDSAADGAVATLYSYVRDASARYGPSSDIDLAGLFDLVDRCNARLTASPIGDTGLHFVGTGEFSVEQIERENALAEEVDRYLANEAQWDAVQSSNARDGDDARRHEPEWATKLFELTRERLRDGPFTDLLHRLPSRGPAFARQPSRSYSDYLWRYATQPWILTTAGIFLALTIGVLLSGFWSGWGGLETYVTVWLTPALVILTLLVVAFALLLRHEACEKPDRQRIDIEALRRIRDAEERADHAQTHITTVSTLKKGVLRRLTFSLAMHVIGSFVRLWFRPGFLTDFATIHYARWMRFSGTDQMVFQSNYDGSWESYLEDFVTKVHGGQTLAWNNAEGFPKTRLLWRDGARDGDRFKRWVRRQQVETPFWYAHFPDLTIPQIHMNALVRDGLARARDVSDHRAWLKLFGSVPRKGTELETDQIQSIVFRGHGGHEAAACVPLYFKDPVQAREWIGQLLRQSENTSSAGDVMTTRRDSGGILSAESLVLQPVLAFGDGEPRQAALFLGLSAGGLAKLGLVREDQFGLNAFPGPFLDGMRERGAALKDPTELLWSDAGWMPGASGHGAAVHNADVALDDLPDGAYRTSFPADAVLLVYVRSPAIAASDDDDGTRPSVWKDPTFAPVYERIESELEQFSIKPKFGVDLSRGRGASPSLGGFGFHEGASQPVMRGTRAAARKGDKEQDVLPPGEFILGYENTRGDIAPAIAVRPDSAARDCLPFVLPPRSEPYPYFGDATVGHRHDLGRNGSFLVIRQLRHDKGLDAAGNETETFHIFVRNEASRLAELIRGGVETYTRPPEGKDKWQGSSARETANDNGTADGVEYTRPAPLGEISVTDDPRFLEELIAAKMFGRWRDGSSLVHHPLMSATARRRQHTFRGVLSSSVGSLVKERYDPLGEGSHTAAADRLLWDDEEWDRFVVVAREAIVEATGSEPPAPTIQRWLVPYRAWPDMTDNDFDFGRDDPQGLGCPIGAHIRRANPRDTPNPHNPDQVAINNRHRLLRRGRPYRLREDPRIVGTHFMCLNSDIERQFEFVQRTWLNAPHFHGLVRQPDPIAAPHGLNDRFVIPHASNVTDLRYDRRYTTGGEVRQDGDAGITRVACDPDSLGRSEVKQFTSLVGGGYFFLPSRAALAYLSHPDRTHSVNADVS